MAISFFKKIYNILGKILEVIGVAIASLMFILLAYQIFLRIFTGQGDVRANEMVTYLFIWLIYFGMIEAARNKTHMRVSMLADAFKPRVKNIIYLISNLLWGYYSVYVVLISSKLINQFQALGSKTSVLQIPIWATYLVLPIAFGWSCIYIVRDAIDNVKVIIDPSKEVKETDELAGGEN